VWGLGTYRNFSRGKGRLEREDDERLVVPSASLRELYNIWHLLSLVVLKTIPRYGYKSKVACLVGDCTRRSVKLNLWPE